MDKILPDEKELEGIDIPDIEMDKLPEIKEIELGDLTDEFPWTDELVMFTAKIEFENGAIIRYKWTDERVVNNVYIYEGNIYGNQEYMTDSMERHILGQIELYINNLKDNPGMCKFVWGEKFTVLSK